MAVIVSAHAAGFDQTYVAGASGWALESFGRDVAILRAAIGEGANASAGSLVLSCDGGTGRLTLILPKSASNFDSRLTSAGSILVRPLGPDVAAFPPVVARTAGKRPDALMILGDDPAAGRPVLAIARILAARPIGLDFLLHTGTGHITLGGLTPLRIAVSSRDVDEVAFRDFAATCEYQSPRL